MAETVTVLTPGISSVQDLGRGSASQFGQATGGAADQISAEIANALVGSRREAPLLELTALDFSASASTDLLIAVTGAPATVTVDGHRQPQWEPIVWRAGQRLAVTGIHDGLRVYVAVHGELTADYLLGSCAPDQVLGFGRHLTAGRRWSSTPTARRSTTRSSGYRCSGCCPTDRPSATCGRST
ncbi:hypothetical protein ACQGFI_31185 [Rhodococcus sp. 2.95]